MGTTENPDELQSRRTGAPRAAAKKPQTAAGRRQCGLVPAHAGFLLLGRRPRSGRVVSWISDQLPTNLFLLRGRGKRFSTPRPFSGALGSAAMSTGVRSSRTWAHPRKRGAPAQPFDAPLPPSPSLRDRSSAAPARIPDRASLILRLVYFHADQRGQVFLATAQRDDTAVGIAQEHRNAAVAAERYRSLRDRDVVLAQPATAPAIDPTRNAKCVQPGYLAGTSICRLWRGSRRQSPVTGSGSQSPPFDLCYREIRRAGCGALRCHVLFEPASIVSRHG